MKASAPIGSYVPGTTAVHRVDARVKLLIVTAGLIVVFAIRSWAALAMCAAAVALLAHVARVPRGWLARSLSPVAPLLVLTVVLNGIFLWQAVDIWRRPTNANVWRLYKYSLLYLALVFVAMGIGEQIFSGQQSCILNAS